MVFNAAKLMAAKWPAELVEMLWADNPDRLIAAGGHARCVVCTSLEA